MADDAPRFEKTRFAVLALGDRAYAQFCEIGRRIDERLAALGGARIADRIECDLDFETPATGWIDSTLERLNAEVGVKDAGASVIHVDFARPGAEAPTRARPFEAEITEHVRLTGSRSTSDTHHVAVSLEGSGILYEPGDSLGVIPSNDPALVDAVLRAAGLSGDDTLRDALIDRLDITTLTAQADRGFRPRDRDAGAAGGLGGRAADHRPAGDRAGRVDGGTTDRSAASAAAAVLLDRLQPQGGGRGGASAGRRRCAMRRTGGNAPAWRRWTSPRGIARATG